MNVVIPPSVESLSELWQACVSVSSTDCRAYAQMLRDHAAQHLDEVADFEMVTGQHWSSVVTARLAAVLERAADVIDAADTPRPA